MRPVKFDAADICSTIIKGRDSSTWFDAMQVQVARIKADIQDAYSALAETDQRLGTPGLTQPQLKTNQTIRKAQEERVNFNNQLENFISVRCPAYFQEHRFDGQLVDLDMTRLSARVRQAGSVPEPILALMRNCVASLTPLNAWRSVAS